MPWCEDCERFLTPNSLGVDGGCPSCGRVVTTAPGATSEGEAEEAEYKAPWHFKVMVVALVVYLGWRAYQLIEQLVT
jgi:hypothetical protein